MDGRKAREGAAGNPEERLVALMPHQGDLSPAGTVPCECSIAQGSTTLGASIHTAPDDKFKMAYKTRI